MSVLRNVIVFVALTMLCTADSTQDLASVLKSYRGTLELTLAQRQQIHKQFLLWLDQQLKQGASIDQMNQRLREADLIRETGTIPDYRFYDEREWRYLPQFDCAVCEMRRTDKEYQEWRATSTTKPLLQEISLSFEFSDIEHIIVEKENRESHLHILR